MNARGLSIQLPECLELIASEKWAQPVVVVVGVL